MRNALIRWLWAASQLRRQQTLSRVEPAPLVLGDPQELRLGTAAAASSAAFAPYSSITTSSPPPYEASEEDSAKLIEFKLHSSASRTSDPWSLYMRHRRI
ncbi:hypothetical protein PG987_009567 [Apiospora arundinis]